MLCRASVSAFNVQLPSAIRALALLAAFCLGNALILHAVPFADFDMDGNIQLQEALDDTSDTDVDDLLEHGTSVYCAEWNGFLSTFVQIFELRNAGGTPIDVQIRLFSSAGKGSGSTSITIAPKQQFDFVVNAADGFTTDSYGQVCASIGSGVQDSLDAHLSTYRFSGDGSEPGGFTLAYSVPGSSGREGKQFVGYNHYYPTANPVELGNFTAGFVQVSNLEATGESGELIYYDEEGTERRRTPVVLSSFGRSDFDTHGLGANRVGRVEWAPNASDKRFRVVLNRYYYDSGDPGAIIGAVAIPAKIGSGAVSGIPFSLDGTIAVVELVNALNVQTSVQLDITDAQGVRAASQPAAIVLPPRATRHVVLNSFLPPGSVGLATVSGFPSGSVVATSLEYGLNENGGIVYASNGDVAPASTAKQLVSYNNFLGGCDLRLANLSSAHLDAKLGMTRYDGTDIALNDVVVPANGAVVVNVCSAETQPAYGEVAITAAAKGIVAEMVRKSRNSNAQFRFRAQPRGKYETSIEVSPSSLTLTPGASGPGNFTVTNNSPLGGTARNVRVTLDPSLSDVSVAPNQRPLLAAAQSCSIALVPGAGTHPVTHVTIVADNAPPVESAVEVVAPAPTMSTISSSPTSLTFAANPTGVLTVTNTSSQVSANNIATMVPGGSNILVQSTTCGASLAVGASCTITFASGVPEGPTSVQIAGDNTNTLSIGMTVTPAPILVAAISSSPPSLVFAENSTGNLTITNSAGSQVAATNIAATVPGGSNISVQSTTCGASLAIGASCTIAFASNAQEGPTTVPVAGDNTNTVAVDVTVTAQPQISITNPVQQNRLITVSGTALSLEIINDAGSAVNANAITVANRTACPNLVVDDSNCASVAPGASCTLALTSDTPYAPCTLTISGSNTANSPQTLVAFSHLGGIVFEENAGSGKIVIDASQAFASTWTATNSTTVGAASNTDGESNTALIVASPSCSDNPAQCAAQRCRDIGADWYLPAIDELTAMAAVLCSNGAAPCDFGGSSHWASTETSFLGARVVIFPSGIIAVTGKLGTFTVRCARAFTP